MKKEKLVSLINYTKTLKAKLASSTPPKHAHRLAEYKAFLEREIKLNNIKVDAELIKEK